MVGFKGSPSSTSPMMGSSRVNVLPVAKWPMVAFFTDQLKAFRCDCVLYFPFQKLASTNLSHKQKLFTNRGFSCWLNPKWKTLIGLERGRERCVEGERSYKNRRVLRLSKTFSSDQVPSTGTTCTPLFMGYFNPREGYDVDFKIHTVQCQGHETQGKMEQLSHIGRD